MVTLTPAANNNPGVQVSYMGTSFTIPFGLATGTSSEIKPKSPDDQLGIPYLKNPTYVHFQLQGYLLPDKLYKPEISIYPIKEYARLVENVPQTVSDLQSILTTQHTSPTDPIPFLPYQDASQVFHAQKKFMSFKNGTGIRYITEYSQAHFPIVNNEDLFYTFQGLTSDGAYYISVILPT